MENDINVLDELHKGCCMGIDALDLILKKSDNYDFNDLLEEIPDKIKQDGTEKDFMDRYRKAKLNAKLRLKEFVKKNCNIDIDENFMFDILITSQIILLF